MRENTRWEVEEPISTPTLNMKISASPSRLRPVGEKKNRPPASSVSMFIQFPIRSALSPQKCRSPAHGLSASPRPACGERSDREAIRVRGRFGEAEALRLVEKPPHPDPLPARGAREQHRLA